MAKFCGKCGERLNTKTGKCPHCDASEVIKNNEYNPQIEGENNTDKITLSKKEKRKQQKFEKKKAKIRKKEEAKRSMSKGKKVRSFLIKLLFFVITVAFFVACIMLGLVKLNIIKRQDVMDILGIKESRTIEEMKEEETLEETTSAFYEVPAKDADEYYKNNSQIIAEINVKDSDKVSSEKDIMGNFMNRGFGDYPITYEYSMDGEYLDVAEIVGSSDEKHPMYTTYYVTEDGNLWTIMEINGRIFANPVFYNEQSELQAQLIISETYSVVSYDSAKNKFYETVPGKLTLIVKKVDKINAETLEKLTIEEINSL